MAQQRGFPAHFEEMCPEIQDVLHIANHAGHNQQSDHQRLRELAASAQSVGLKLELQGKDKLECDTISWVNAVK